MTFDDACAPSSECQHDGSKIKLIAHYTLSVVDAEEKSSSSGNPDENGLFSKFLKRR